MPVMDAATQQPVTLGDVSYMATFELGDDGLWAAQVVELPEAISQGRSLEEAQRNLAEALGLALELRAAEGTEIPQGGRVGGRASNRTTVKRTELERWMRSHRGLLEGLRLFRSAR